jgi:nucleotide-binding universal stress UspA family protein
METIMYKKVLVPLDGSELAECALNHVKSLFKDGSVGTVILLNIVKVDITWVQADDGHKHLEINKIREEVLKSSQKYLANVESRLTSEGMKVKIESLEANRPAHAIIEYAQQNEINMIVIATHGYTGMKGMMMGSVAFGVLHQSHVPVLLIRPEACRV